MSTNTNTDGLGQFADLVTVLGTSTKTTDKLNALVHYFSNSADQDKVWVIALFTGRKPKRAISTRQLTDWCVQEAGLPGWLFGESYHTVGDLAETIALLLPESELEIQQQPLHYYIDTFRQIEKQDEQVKKQFVLESWAHMNTSQRFVFNKLITGAFRIGVSQKMMVNALAKFTDISPSVIAHSISGNWDPSSTSFTHLLNENNTTTDFSKPYPFYLAYALEAEPATLGAPNDWQVEWKWDGIRGQLIKRNHELFVWSRGEELMTEKFPEYNTLLPLLPDGVVLDGEIIPSINQQPLAFSLLQTRIGRKNITKKNLQETPITFFAYDLLEYNYEDWRGRTLQERRVQLESVIASIDSGVIMLSPKVMFSNWDELRALRTSSREMGAEGFMLKRKTSIYQVGRKVGDWWKWKIEPLVIDCVMIYAEKGSGRRSNLYTAYTFAVRDGEKLVPFTRAYSGLTDKEFGEVDAFVKRNAIEKFGPVRTVKPELVFEIAFEGIAASNRHKSGVALRFPRISRWRKDKNATEINTLDDLKKMLEVYGNAKS